MHVLIVYLYMQIRMLADTHCSRLMLSSSKVWGILFNLF